MSNSDVLQQQAKNASTESAKTNKSHASKVYYSNFAELKDPEPIDNIFENKEEFRKLNDRTWLFINNYSQSGTELLPDEKEWDELTDEVKNITKHLLIHRSPAYAKWRHRQPDIFAYASSLPGNLCVIKDCFASDEPYSLMDLPHCSMPKVYDKELNNEARLHELDRMINFRSSCVVDTKRIINLFVKRYESIDAFITPFAPQEDKFDYHLINQLFAVPEDGNIKGITFTQEETQLPKFSNLSKIGYEFALDCNTREPIAPEKRGLLCPYQAEKHQPMIEPEPEVEVDVDDENINLSYLMNVRTPFELTEKDFLNENQLKKWVKKYAIPTLGVSEGLESDPLRVYVDFFDPIIGPIGKQSFLESKRALKVVRKYKAGDDDQETQRKSSDKIERVLSAYKGKDNLSAPKNGGNAKDSLIFEDTFKAMHDLAGRTSSKIVLEEILASLLQAKPNYERIIEEGFYLARHGELFGLCAVAISYILRNDPTKGEQQFRDNFDRALIYLELAAANREPYSCYLLSWLASRNVYRKMPDDKRESMIFTYLIRAADDGLDLAQIALAFKYKEHKLFELYGHYMLLAARQFNPLALLEGERIATRGVLAQPDPGLGWFMLALYASYLPNDVRVFQRVGLNLLSSGLLEPERNTNVTAVRMMERAACVSLRSCYFVGLMYYDGSFIQEDLAKARYYFERTAKFRIKDSRLLLAAMCERGDGGPVDIKRALDLYLKAMLEDKLEQGAEGYINLLLQLSIQSSYGFDAEEGYKLAQQVFPNHKTYWQVRWQEALQVVEKSLAYASFIRSVDTIYQNVHLNTPELETRIEKGVSQYLRNKLKKSLRNRFTGDMF